MNPIIAILKEHNIADEQIKSLFETLTENPLMAMAVVQQLGIPQDKLQQLMGLVMQNPGLIKEAVDELGLDFSKVEAAKAKLSNPQG
jgi:TRAP-type mannitol/chloroaromatic compound transport system permease large subunit